ncbi:MAG: DEAD/DEAH box helicase [Nitrososphaerota archaeon]|nr:DEAD/DEAH box helicase [Candidatus Calditenuaceae archaeon]MDW8073120.1 DEAD/DEAH box helicase [Nitrososphaerota archaeon]
MRIEEAGLSRWLLESLKREGIETFYPPQAEALRKGLLQGKNIVVSSPTASGKTLIAIMAAHRHLESGRKVLYLTPLRALTYEKMVEFKRIIGENGLGFKVAAVSGDYDDPGEWIGRNDVIVSTYEKADSLVRHRAKWLSSIGLVVVDEAHMIGDPDRGPTLEMTIAKLLETLESPQILCLSATVRNIMDFAGWLEAVPVQSDFRPVPLREGVLQGARVVFSDGETRALKSGGEPLSALVLDSLRDGGQVLVFALTRRKAEAYAERLAQTISGSKVLDESWRARLEDYSRKILEESESPFSERLASLVSRGAAFHHAGLGYFHRRLIEDAFREGAIPVLCATPTLAAGVNLPARMVVIPEHRRFDSRSGMRSLSVTEYKQFCGRAGRPLYDSIGYAILFAANRVEAEYLMEKYIRGEPERVFSVLGSERHLRSHILSLIASGLARSELALGRIISRTFYAHIFGTQGLSEKIDSILEMLQAHSLISRDIGLEATRLGTRVSELYIDPVTCIDILHYTAGVERLSTLAALQVICLTPDLSETTVARIRSSTLERVLNEIGEELLVEPPDPEEYPEDYEFHIDSLKNAVVLWSWVNEVHERDIYERFNVEPGDFAAIRERAEWISYAASSILEVAGRKKLASVYRALTERLKHGVQEELLQLVSLPEIGRVRGRMLWRNGFRTVEDVRRASLDDLAKVPGIGTAIAAKIKRAAEELNP